ncbi:hypothetical protein ACH4NT_05735 [Streptomyces lydicus]
MRPIGDEESRSVARVRLGWGGYWALAVGRTTVSLTSTSAGRLMATPPGE